MGPARTLISSSIGTLLQRRRRRTPSSRIFPAASGSERSSPSQCPASTPRSSPAGGCPQASSKNCLRTLPPPARRFCSRCGQRSSRCPRDPPHGQPADQRSVALVFHQASHPSLLVITNYGLAPSAGQGTRNVQLEHPLATIPQERVWPDERDAGGPGHRQVVGTDISCSSAAAKCRPACHRAVFAGKELSLFVSRVKDARH